MHRTWHREFEPDLNGEPRLLRLEYQTGGTIDIIAQEGDQLILGLFDMPLGELLAAFLTMADYAQSDSEGRMENMISGCREV
jgi:hypothetical protein